MNIRELIEQIGGSELARRLQVSRGLVSHWKQGRQRPSARLAKEIEKTTNGVVKREEIRPDIFG